MCYIDGVTLETTKETNIMLTIDTTLLGRKFYTVDPKTVYTCRGIYVQPDSYPILIGEYADPAYKCNRLATVKVGDAKFTDFVAAPTAP